MRFTPAQRFAFRFWFAYVLLYLSPLQVFDFIPGMERVAQRTTDLWNRIVPWVALHVFGVAGEVHVGDHAGSGDSAADYVQTACVAALALFIAAIWSVASRPPYRDRDLWTLLRTYVRYALAAIVLGYGFIKAFPLQFSSPRPEQLLAPLGNTSPMGLLWRFMGYSTPYQVFGGLAEITGAVLLFSRRTTPLGALILAGVLGNVVMLNFCFDVPVKISSSHLLLLTLFLLLPDARRLAAVLVWNRPAPPADSRPHDLLVRFRGAHMALKALLVVAIIGVPAHEYYTAYTEEVRAASKGPLYGVYEVEDFTKNGQAVAPLLTEKGRWRRVAADNFLWSAFLMNDTIRRYYVMKYDESAGELTLSRSEDEQYKLSVARPDPDHLQIEGALENDNIRVRLKKIDLASMNLVGRGFHWVNEEPFNR